MAFDLGEDGARVRAFVALAGGGARGVVHVGAVRALERQGVEVLGWAGTSAGAIVATLAAAGFRADDLVSEDGRRSILDRFNAVDHRVHRATDLFGFGGWPLIVLFREASAVLGWFLALFATAAVALPLASVFMVAHHSMSAWATPVWIWDGLFACVAAAALLALFGLTSMARLRRSLGLVLQQRLFPDEPGRVVRMSDFDGRDGRSVLKIVASNLRSRDLELFSADNGQNASTPVADAVCASICLPIIFRLWKIGAARYVDGGIVSNLPAWPFDEERALDPAALTLAFDIPASAVTSSPGPLNWLPATIQTGFFGRALLNLRGMRQVELVELETSLGVLDFDLDREQLVREVGDATNAAETALDRRLFQEPRVLRAACEAARTSVLDVLAQAGSEVLPAGGAGRVRVAVAGPDRGFVRTVRRRQTAGFEAGDADGGALVSLVGQVGPPEAWTSLEPELELSARGELGFEQSGGDAGRPAWRGVRWRLSVPISEPRAGEAGKLLVLLDGSAPLAPGQPTEDVMTRLAEGVKVLFAGVLEALHTGEENADGQA